MIATSAEFHAAIKRDEPQMPLFIFDGKAVMSAQDVTASGLRFSENVMSGEDFVPGDCCSATLNFQVVNESKAWSNFDYGEFTALLGVRTHTERTDKRIPCYIRVDANVIEGWPEYPYLRFNGSAISEVTEPVKALVLFEEKLFAFTDSGYVGFTYNGTAILKTAFGVYDAPIIRNSAKWKYLNYGIVYGHTMSGITTGLADENNLVIFGRNFIDAYELIPLGVFTAERPVYSSRKSVSVDAFDRMTKFDADYDASQFQFPMTVFGLLQRVCAVAGVPPKNTSITNGEVTIPSAPDFEGNTLRDVLSYIAEISGDFARIDRYGRVELKWFTSAAITLDAHDYSECDVGFYHAAGVDQLVIRELGKDDVTFGQGENIWYLQQNPIVEAILTGGG